MAVALGERSVFPERCKCGTSLQEPAETAAEEGVKIAFAGAFCNCGRHTFGHQLALRFNVGGRHRKPQESPEIKKKSR